MNVKFKNRFSWKGFMGIVLFIFGLIFLIFIFSYEMYYVNFIFTLLYAMIAGAMIGIGLKLTIQDTIRQEKIKENHENRN